MLYTETALKIYYASTKKFNNYYEKVTVKFTGEIYKYQLKLVSWKVEKFGKELQCYFKVLPVLINELYTF